MVATKSAAEVAKKWAEVTPGRQQFYDAGVKAPKKDWADETAKSEAAYEQGISEALAGNRFGKGVRKAGTEAWQKGAIEKGISRFGPGVRASEDKMEKGVAPYLEELGRITLPERGARGDPRNIERVSKIASALHKKKLELLG